MDKTQKKALDFMVYTTYRDVIQRSISYYVLKAVAEMKDTLTIDKDSLSQAVKNIPPEMHGQVLLAFKDKVFLQLLKTDRTEKHLQSILDDTIKMKADMVAEVMKQYGTDKGSDAVYIHDKMCGIFDGCINRTREALHKGDFDFIREKWKGF